MDENVRKRADKLLALSKMTLPHQFARVVLLEQIYRACTLMRNISQPPWASMTAIWRLFSRATNMYTPYGS